MDVIVNVRQGKLRGSVGISVKGDQFVQFLGIPYAKPPVGKLRFKAPEPPESWTGERDATKEGSPCLQYDLFTRQLLGSEDCLHLNVFTKNVGDHDLKPVLVWIHGGGFMSGSNSTTLYGPEVLMTRDVVLVSINYRLGIFGFLCLEDTSLGVPGNNGLKDMVLALKWIQENIEKFSGDPKNVTIFGESAGGAAVHSLVLSAATKGLFHRAIAMSGSMLSTWAKGSTNAKRALKTLGKEAETEKEALSILMNASPEELTVRLTEDDGGFSEPMPFAPVAEYPNPTALITKASRDIIASGEYNQVPFMLGWTNREGLIVDIFSSRSGLNPQDAIEALLPHELGYKRGTRKNKEVATSIRQFYLENNSEGFYDYITDVTIVKGITESAEQHSKTSTQPTYLYQVSVETQLALTKNLFKDSKPGVCHMDELGFLFKPKLYERVCEPGSLEEIATERMLSLFINFAKYGNPTPSARELGVSWRPVEDGGHLNYLDIGENLSLKVGIFPERFAFWKQLVVDSKA